MDKQIKEWCYGRHPAYDANGNFWPAERLVEVIDALLAHARDVDSTLNAMAQNDAIA